MACLGQAAAQGAVGQWQDWAAFGKTHRLALAGDKVYAASNLGLICYDRDTKKCGKLSKSHGLTDAEISTIAYDEESGCLVVAYKNASIDLLKQGSVRTVADIKRADIPADKTIYHVRFRNGKAYLACGFGLVVVDLVRTEIENSCYLGTGGSYAAVYDVAFVGDKIVVATDNGLLQADADDPLLNIVSRWEADPTVLASMKVTELAYHENHLYALTYDGSENVVYSRQDDMVTLYCSAPRIESLRGSQGRLILCMADSLRIEGNGIGETITGIDWYTPKCEDALLDEEGTLWTGHDWAGLVEVAADRTQAAWHKPEGPESDNVYALVPYRNKMLLCPGGHTSTYAQSGVPGNVQTYRKGLWKQLDRNGFDFTDVLDVAVNPKDTNEMLAASWGGGIVRIVNNRVEEIYDEGSTQGALTPYVTGGYSTMRTGAVCFDRQGNAWMTNSLVGNGLVERKKDGSWQAFETYSMVGHKEVDKMFYDMQNDYIWMLGRENRIYVHNGKDKMAWIDPNNGSRLQTNNVNCMVQDLDGEVWLGTDKGIKVIYNSYNVMNNGGNGEKAPTTCSNVVIRDEFDEYLMHYENISCMAVDGANRKWVGTYSGGLYLISESGQDQVEHFTAANSPLMSDKVIAVAVLPETGEVFVGTDMGVQSYRGTATAGVNFIDKDKIHAFPNPVKPDYEGPIAIKGFSTNALVHITNAAGHVVYATRADGGQAIWYGRTNEGQRVGSGVYYVFASDAAGEMRAVSKVLIVK